MPMTPEERRAKNEKELARYHANKATIRAQRHAKYHADLAATHAKNAAYRDAHREQINAKQRERNVKFRQELRDWQAAYRTKNHTKLLERARRNAEKNRESRNARARLRQQANMPQFVEKNRKRRALKYNAGINDFTVRQWEEMKTAYDHRCVYCGRKMQRLTQDHITPLSKGGNHTYSNIVPACKSCNSKKHDGAVLCPVQPLLVL